MKLRHRKGKLASEKVMARELSKSALLRTLSEFLSADFGESIVYLVDLGIHGVIHLY